MVEMNAALKAEGQRTLIIGNRATVVDDKSRANGIASKKWVNTFTSNADGSRGYNLEGDKRLGEPSALVCVRGKFTNIRLYDARKPGTPPEAKRGGAFDESLRRNEAAGTRPMLQADAMATAPDGTVRLGNGFTLFGNIAVKGAFPVINYPDGTFSDMFVMTDTEYTPTALASFKN